MVLCDVLPDVRCVWCVIAGWWCPRRVRRVESNESKKQVNKATFEKIVQTSSLHQGELLPIVQPVSTVLVALQQYVVKVCAKNKGGDVEISPSFNERRTVLYKQINLERINNVQYGNLASKLYKWQDAF